MEFSRLHTDETILGELGERLARYRLQANQSQADLAREAGISKRTLERIEAGQGTQTSNFIRVLRALDLLGGLEQLVPRPGPSPMEYVENRGRERQRASSSAIAEPRAASEWTWGDDD